MAVAIGLDGDCDIAAMTHAPGDCPDDLLAAARLDRVPTALAEAQA